MLDPACIVLAPGMTVRSLFPVLLCLVGQSFKDRSPTSEGRKAESVTYSPCTAGVSLSRLRVQRYGDFSKPPNLFDTFLQKTFRGVIYVNCLARVHLIISAGTGKEREVKSEK